MNTNRLNLPFILSSQAQKHVTHNEALQAIDILVHLTVVDQGRTQPPPSNEEGDCYIVGGDADGEWQNHDFEIACYQNEVWSYHQPLEGWRAWIISEAVLLVYHQNEWVPVGAELSEISSLGVNTQSDDVNRLSVKSDAVLFSHDDVNGGSGDHRLILNKSTETHTAAMIMQNNYSGRAEIGLTGGDDFKFKVSSDGTNFVDAISIDHITGNVHFNQSVSGITPTEFGNDPTITSAYSAAKGSDLFVNGSGLLGNTYNLPSKFSLDRIITPNLPASFSFKGYRTGVHYSHEFLPVDPNNVYRLRSYLLQEGLAGDWSAHTFGERHRQFMGFVAYDIDLNQIRADDHMIYNNSRTELSQPLSPGDSEIFVNDISNWQNGNSAAWQRRIVIFEYKNSNGFKYENYSRLWGARSGMWDVGAIDFANNKVLLNTPLEDSLANPDHPDGIWPVGTKVANASLAGSFKYSYYSALVLPQVDTWYKTESFVGGVDYTGTNMQARFSPGTAFVKLMWLANDTNRAGGFGDFADTGEDHAVHFAGVSLIPEPMAKMQNGNLLLPQLNQAGDAFEVVTNPRGTVEEV